MGQLQLKLNWASMCAANGGGTSAAGEVLAQMETRHTTGGRSASSNLVRVLLPCAAAAAPPQLRRWRVAVGPAGPARRRIARPGEAGPPELLRGELHRRRRASAGPKAPPLAPQPAAAGPLLSCRCCPGLIYMGMQAFPARRMPLAWARRSHGRPTACARRGPGSTSPPRASTRCAALRWPGSATSKCPEEAFAALPSVALLPGEEGEARTPSPQPLEASQPP